MVNNCLKLLNKEFMVICFFYKTICAFFNGQIFQLPFITAGVEYNFNIVTVINADKINDLTSLECRHIYIQKQAVRLFISYCQCRTDWVFPGDNLVSLIFNNIFSYLE